MNLGVSIAVGLFHVPPPKCIAGAELIRVLACMARTPAAAGGDSDTSRHMLFQRGARSPTIQRMRSHGLNCALAVIAIVAVVAACSRATEQAEKTAARAVTFNGDIAPILFDNCASCHRPIDDAPRRERRCEAVGEGGFLR